jgi:UDP-2,3-diacylglucosamine pyrophosphatase LpxH
VVPGLAADAVHQVKVDRVPFSHDFNRNEIEILCFKTSFALATGLSAAAPGRILRNAVRIRSQGGFDMRELKKARRAIVGIVLAALFIVAPCGLAFADEIKAAEYALSCLNISPGANASELNFAWLTPKLGKTIVQMAKATDKTSAEFPADKAVSFSGSQAIVTATTFNTDDVTAPTGLFSNKVTVNGLANSTEYVYRVGDGSNWSDTYAVSTRDPKAFGFLVVGDPQLGSKATGPKTLEADTAGWTSLLNKATALYPDSSFMLSLGDQVNDYSDRAKQDAEYLTYFSPKQLRSLPVATVDGNHDFAMGEYYGYHYNLPNLSSQYGVSYGNDGDYWFRYGNALFLMLNSNTESVYTHDLFIRDAVAKNPGTTWRIACFHHAIYSEADHVNDPDIIDRRASYVPVLERYKIDIVLMGHDHAYTRTFQMLGGKPQKTQVQDTSGTVINPTGILYLTFNSGSGSKFYDWKNSSAPEAYSAARWQGKVPSFGHISISGGVFTFTEYRADDMSVIDSYSMIKTE